MNVLQHYLYNMVLGLVLLFFYIILLSLVLHSQNIIIITVWAVLTLGYTGVMALIWS